MAENKNGGTMNTHALYHNGLLFTEKRNMLICGDNFEILPQIEKESVDLIYIDPPFFSNKQYAVIWGDEAEIRSFEDRWAGGIENYIGWMKPRVAELYRTLKPTGSFYLHCDWHASHYLKVMCDDIFGHRCFRNEIVWHYRRWTAGTKKFQRLHDIILFYSKSDDYTFNTQYEPYGDWIKKDYQYVDKNGKRWRWHTVKGKRYKVYLEDKNRGVKLGDVWQIPFIGSTAKERLGYPTQKPEALLERIIRSGTNSGNLVLDAFCGCGTTMAVAHKLKRKWIGTDISPTAIKLVERRLKIIGAIKNEHYVTIGLPTTIKELKKLKPFEFQNWVLDEMGGIVSRKKVGDKGLNGHLTKTLWHEKAGIQVKQSERVGRNVVDNFETALRRKKYTKGYIVAFSFTRGAHEEVARVKNKGELEIKLITVKELLDKKKTLLK